MKVGSKVDYHAIIAGPITSRGHVVTHLGTMCGQSVAWITGKSGCVAITALSPSEELPSFTCPRCGAVSFNPNDMANRYCGRCHDFTAP